MEVHDKLTHLDTHLVNTSHEDINSSQSTCLCTNSNDQSTVNIPSLIGNDCFCETGVPPGQRYNYTHTLFYATGMVKVVVQLAHAAHSTIHHGFVPQSTDANLKVRLYL